MGGTYNLRLKVQKISLTLIRIELSVVLSRAPTFESGLVKKPSKSPQSQPKKGSNAPNKKGVLAFFVPLERLSHLRLTFFGQLFFLWFPKPDLPG